MAERIRVVVADVTPDVCDAAPDTDDRGAASIARALRDAGSEVVYTGPDQTAEQLVQTVVQEDADALVMTTGADAGGTVLRTAGLLAENDADDVLVFAVGTVSDHDAAELGATAVVTVLRPGSTVAEIVARVHAGTAARSDI